MYSEYRFVCRKVQADYTLLIIDGSCITYNKFARQLYAHYGYGLELGENDNVYCRIPAADINMIAERYDCHVVEVTDSDPKWRADISRKKLSK